MAWMGTIKTLDATRNLVALDARTVLELACTFETLTVEVK